VVVHPGLGNFAWETLDLAWPTPALEAEGDAELDVIADLLAERLWERFGEDGSAFRVSVGQNSLALGSHFRVSVSLEPGHSHDDALAIVDRGLERLAKPLARVERLKRARVVRALRSQDDFAERARRLATGVDADDAARYRALTPERVALVARRHLIGRP